LRNTSLPLCLAGNPPPFPLSFLGPSATKITVPQMPSSITFSHHSAASLSTFLPFFYRRPRKDHGRMPASQISEP
jgi:hypothetical protein